jgi:hypothetical protein
MYFIACLTLAQEELASGLARPPAGPPDPARPRRMLACHGEWRRA